MNSPLLFVCQRTKFVPLFPQALRWREVVHNLLVDFVSYGPDRQLDSVQEYPSCWLSW